MRDDELPFFWLNPVVRKLSAWRVLSRIASAGTFLCRSWTVFSAIVEDLPYPENHVMPQSGLGRGHRLYLPLSGRVASSGTLMFDGFKHAVDTFFDVRCLNHRRASTAVTCAAPAASATILGRACSTATTALTTWTIFMSSTRLLSVERRDQSESDNCGQ